jgi:hypothetical protein
MLGDSVHMALVRDGRRVKATYVVEKSRMGPNGMWVYQLKDGSGELAGEGD